MPDIVAQAIADTAPAVLVGLPARTWLVSVSIGLYSGRKSARRVAQKGVATITRESGQAMKSDRFSAWKALIEPKRLDVFRAHRQATRDLWETESLPWGQNGTRIMLGSRFHVLKRKLDARKVEWQALVDRLIPDFPDLIKDARYALGAEFDINDYRLRPGPDGLPTLHTAHDGTLTVRLSPAYVQALRDRFYFDYSLTEPSTLPDWSQDWRFEGLTPAERQELERQTIATQTRTLAAAQAAAWETVLIPLAKMATTLRDYTGGRKGSFQQSLVDNLTEALDRLPGLNLTGEPMLDQVAEIARTLTTETVVTLRDDETKRAEFAAISAETVRASIAHMRDRAGLIEDTEALTKALTDELGGLL